METQAVADATIVRWLNGWVGTLPWLDTGVKVLISDYFAPVVMSLLLLALWFSGSPAAVRAWRQRSVGIAAASIGIVNLIVKIMNALYFRPRPYASLDLDLLFYRAPDSSFPANLVAVVFAAAASVWMGHRRAGVVLAVMGAAVGIARIYAGVYYPLDVLGGAALGVATAPLAAWLFRVLEPLPTITLRVMRVLRLA